MAARHDELPLEEAGAARQSLGLFDSLLPFVLRNLLLGQGHDASRGVPRLVGVEYSADRDIRDGGSPGEETGPALATTYLLRVLLLPLSGRASRHHPDVIADFIEGTAPSKTG